MWRFKSQPQSLTTINIQPDGIKLTCVEKNKDDIRLSCQCLLPIDEPIFSEGKIKHWQTLTTQLKKLIQENKITGTATIYLPSHLMRVQHLKLPIGLTSADILREIQIQVQKDFPGMQQDLAIDYMSYPHDQLTQEITFAATRKDYLHAYQQCIEKSGLAVNIIDLDIFALHRAICQWWYDEDWLAKDYLLLYIYQSVCVVACFSKRKIIYHHYWTLSSTESLEVQIKQKLTLIMARPDIHVISKVVICGKKAVQDSLRQLKLASPIVLRFPDLFAEQPDKNYFVAWQAASPGIHIW